MGCLLEFDEDLPWQEQIKFFADEELLDMWLNLQQIGYLCNNPEQMADFPFCEPRLLQELTLRMCSRGAPRLC